MAWYTVEADGDIRFDGKASKDAVRSIAYMLAESCSQVSVFKGLSLGKLQFKLIRENGMIEER